MHSKNSTIAHLNMEPPIWCSASGDYGIPRLIVALHWVIIYMCLLGIVYSLFFVTIYINAILSIQLREINMPLRSICLLGTIYLNSHEHQNVEKQRALNFRRIRWLTEAETVQLVFGLPTPHHTTPVRMTLKNVIKERIQLIYSIKEGKKYHMVCFDESCTIVALMPMKPE